MDRQARIVAGKEQDMTQEDILRIAREAGFYTNNGTVFVNGCDIGADMERFAALVAAAEREKLAHWMRSMGYATGQGKTTEDLLDFLGVGIAEGLEAEVLMEREACADICDQHASVEGIAQRCADQIRAREKP
jgi:hypothetical protein